MFIVLSDWASTAGYGGHKQLFPSHKNENGCVCKHYYFIIIKITLLHRNGSLREMRISSFNKNCGHNEEKILKNYHGSECSASRP